MNYEDLKNIKPDYLVYTKPRDMASSQGGEHVGTVDHLDGETYVKMNRKDSPDGRHHWFPTTWVDRVEGNIVHLNKTFEEYERELLDEGPMRSREAG